MAAAELRVGDALLCRDGSHVAVESVEAGAWQLVYNLRVAEYHTYFVGCDEWGFSVWAHNNYGELKTFLVRLAKSKGVGMFPSNQVLRQAAELAQAGMSKSGLSRRQFSELLAPAGLRGDEMEWAWQAARHKLAAGDSTLDYVSRHIEQLQGVPELHHVLTWTNTKAGEAFTPIFEAMAMKAGKVAEGAGGVLDGAWNKVWVRGHQGPHAEYNFEVHAAMQRALDMAGSASEYANAFVATHMWIKTQTQTWNTLFNKLATGKG